MRLLPKPDSLSSAAVRELPPSAVLRWLRLGWRDTRRAGAASLAQGLLVTLASWLIIAISLGYWPLAPIAWSVFLLVGPILATGLYALSRRLDAGRGADFGAVVDAWRHAAPRLLRFGALLAAAALAWVLFSAALLAISGVDYLGGPGEFLRYAVSQGELAFLLWTLLGALGAALVFALTVITVPLLVEREASLPLALAISVRAVGANPLTMACWALTLMLLTGLALASASIGFIVLYPLMGHASWRLYRDLVDADALPARVFAGDGAAP